jgi:predicted AAA+ superfamily ATPase
MSLEKRISKKVEDAGALYYRLVLIVGPPRSGKTTALRHLSDERSWPLLNVNLLLSQSLLELTPQQRALNVNRFLDQIAKEYQGDVIILDNIEVLFNPELQQDPLRLLQRLSRNRTVIAAWAGEQVGDSLTYASPSHPEFKKYDNPDAVVVPTLDAQGVAEQTEKKE